MLAFALLAFPVGLDVKLLSLYRAPSNGTRMSLQMISVERPDRWDHPLDPGISDQTLDWLSVQHPFARMDADRFARTAPLRDVLKNDCRLLEFEKGDIVFREGQYGGSAYLVLEGEVRIFLSSLVFPEAKRNGTPTSNWLSLLSSRLFKSKSESELGVPAPSKLPHSEDRRGSRRNIATRRRRQSAPIRTGQRGHGTNTRIFLQDIPGVLGAHETSSIGCGELFGELAAVTRSPRDFTAMSATRAKVLEIRWQGLKLLKQDPAFRELLDERYRSEVLRNHLRETALFRFVPDEHIDQIVANARLEAFGTLEWYADFRKSSGKTPAERIDKEPLVAEEGHYATGLWIIRGGFARLSRRQGAGHRTLAYLGKGQMFGLRELVHNFRLQEHDAPLPFQESLRAIGYVDALCIPKQTLFAHVLPFVRKVDLPKPISEARYRFGQPLMDAPLHARKHSVDTGLLEFLVDQRLINGKQTMVIDTNRCTRCDDCVRACAATHGGTPVFERTGPQYGPWMFAHACMHCEDPVCMIGCPTGAIHRASESGLVSISGESCIGCKSCAESCPYGNIRMVKALDQQGRVKVAEATGEPILRASKCDLCADVSGRPSCQTACPHAALQRVNLSQVQQVKMLTHRI
ncbi:MAG: cyclic nucleotide-binding domain-containing protein [Planctomycetales bacterium]|nr:cyclic nucleotide-binding domain-containing protein [Planctomycetales bacterium]